MTRTILWPIWLLWRLIVSFVSFASISIRYKRLILGSWKSGILFVIITLAFVALGVTMSMEFMPRLETPLRVAVSIIIWLIISITCFRTIKASPYPHLVKFGGIDYVMGLALGILVSQLQLYLASQT